jgi:hypothetical protein
MTQSENGQGGQLHEYHVRQRPHLNIFYSQEKEDVLHQFLDYNKYTMDTILRCWHRKLNWGGYPLKNKNCDTTHTQSKLHILNIVAVTLLMINYIL